MKNEEEYLNLLKERRISHKDYYGFGQSCETIIIINNINKKDIEMGYTYQDNNPNKVLNST